MHTGGRTSVFVGRAELAGMTRKLNPTVGLRVNAAWETERREVHLSLFRCSENVRTDIGAQE